MRDMDELPSPVTTSVKATVRPPVMGGRLPALSVERPEAVGGLSTSAVVSAASTRARAASAARPPSGCSASCALCVIVTKPGRSPSRTTFRAAVVPLRRTATPGRRSAARAAVSRRAAHRDSRPAAPARWYTCRGAAGHRKPGRPRAGPDGQGHGQHPQRQAAEVVSHVRREAVLEHHPGGAGGNCGRQRRHARTAAVAAAPRPARRLRSAAARPLQPLLRLPGDLRHHERRAREGLRLPVSLLGPVSAAHRLQLRVPLRDGPHAAEQQTLVAEVRRWRRGSHGSGWSGHHTKMGRSACGRASGSRTRHLRLGRLQSALYLACDDIAALDTLVDLPEVQNTGAPRQESRALWTPSCGAG